MSLAEVTNHRVNGIDMAALGDVVEAVAQDPAKGRVAFRVASAWTGGTKSRATVESYTLGGEEIPRRFTMDVDEPHELLGDNTAPNPQEYLMTALNACIMVGYVAGAALKGIALEKLEVETHGTLDLRGFLGLDPDVVPGYQTLSYVVRIKGDGSDDDFRDIHETVMRTSPNYFNVTQPINVEAVLAVER